MLSFKGLFALKGWAIFGWLVFWNLFLGIAVFVNGGFGKIVNPISMYIGFAVLMSTSIFFLGIVFKKDFRKIFISQEREDLYEEESYVTLGIITGALAILMIMNDW